MKIKLLVTIGLSAILLLSACGGSANKNTANNAAVATATTTPIPVTKTNETATTDPALKTKIEDALKKKGFTDVTVDTSTTPATLRGTYPKDKIAEVMATAQEANGKPVKNEATGK